MQFAVGKCLRNFYHFKYRLLSDRIIGPLLALFQEGYYYKHEYYSTCKIVEFVIKNKLGHFEIHIVGVNITRLMKVH